MHLLRRFLVVQILVLWQGGFVFAAAVGEDAVPPHVAVWPNRIGWVALVLCAADVLANRRFRPPRWLVLLVVGGLHVALAFHPHEVLLAGGQWVLMLAFTGLSLAAWRAEDRWLMLRR